VTALGSSLPLERLREAVRSGPPLRLAVLFGSRVSGRPRTESDLDVGILPLHADVSLREELDLASALSAAAGVEVDLVRLDHDDPTLGREVALHGLCLYEGVPGAFAAYRATAISRWLEFEETFGPYRAKFLARLARTRP